MNHSDVELLKDMVHPHLMDTFRSSSLLSHSNATSVQIAVSRINAMAARVIDISHRSCNKPSHSMQCEHPFLDFPAYIT